MKIWGIMFLILLSGCTIHYANEKYNSQRDERLYKELGHQFFFDKSLSFHQNISCATCHNPTLAFSDGYKKSFNAYADELGTNSPSLINVSDHVFFHTSDSTITTLEQQMLRPLYDTNPIEMDWTGHKNEILSRISTKYAFYLKEMNKKSFEEEDIIKSIKIYLLELKSYESAFDKHKKDLKKLGKNAYNGWLLFSSDSLGCTNCHGGKNFDSPKYGSSLAQNEFFSNENSPKYRIPSLRNASITSPYYHDGNTATLREVIRNYERGYILEKGNTKIDSRINKFLLNEVQRNELVSFLYTLTDTSFKHNKWFNPPVK